MTRLFKRIWEEVRKGENLDAYLTIIVALVLSVLNLLGIAPTEKIPAITLTVLALLAVSSLVNRHRVEDLTANLASMRELFVSEFDSKSFKNDLNLADEIWLYGASLDDIVKDYYSLFEKKLKDGKVIKAMVIDPNSPNVLELSEMRAYVNPDAQRAGAKILAALSDFCSLKKISFNLYIRTLKYPITHRMIAINPNHPDGKLYISNYPFGTPGGSLPKFLLTEKDGNWYNLYKREAENLWEAGQDWVCNQSKV
jgi:hypothetical protein